MGTPSLRQVATGYFLHGFCPRSLYPAKSVWAVVPVISDLWPPECFASAVILPAQLNIEPFKFAKKAHVRQCDCVMWESYASIPCLGFLGWPGCDKLRCSSFVPLRRGAVISALPVRSSGVDVSNLFQRVFRVESPLFFYFCRHPLQENNKSITV